MAPTHARQWCGPRARDKNETWTTEDGRMNKSTDDL